MQNNPTNVTQYMYKERKERSTEDKDVTYKNTLRIGTYNIRSGRNSRLEASLRAMAALNVDVCLLTETKLTNGAHSRMAHGYQVYATEANSQFQGGVALCFRERKDMTIENIRKYGHNVISWCMSSGKTKK